MDTFARTWQIDEEVARTAMLRETDERWTRVIETIAGRRGGVREVDMAVAAGSRHTVDVKTDG